MRKIDLTPIYEDFRRRLESGEWRPGERLPSERELSCHLGIARNTLRPVLLRLVEEGLLSRSPWTGTVVRLREQRSRVYYLLPYPGFWEDECSTDKSFPQNLIQCLSRTAYEHNAEILFLYVTEDNVYGHVNEQELGVLQQGDIVIVDSTWYLPVIPFLLSRGVRGLFFMPATEEVGRVMTPEVLDRFSFILTDRKNGCISAYHELRKYGARRIGLFGGYLPAGHPERDGFEEVCRAMDGSWDLCFSMSSDKVYHYSDREVMEYLKKVLREHQLDALMMNSLFGNPDLNEWLRDLIRLPGNFRIFFLNIFNRPEHVGEYDFYNFYDLRQSISQAVQYMLEDRPLPKIQYVKAQIL